MRNHPLQITSWVSYETLAGIWCYASSIISALTVNGVSLLNGKFRISRSTDITDNNGVVFHYVRSPVETVSTEGPLAQPLTVQVSNTLTIT